MSKTPENNGIPEELAPDEDAKARSIVEAILTASDTPVTTGKLADLVGRETGAKEVRRYIDDLNEVYVKTGRAFRISEVAGGFQYSVHHEFAPWIRRLFQERPARLSQAALEVLSIVAFKQPITKAEVEHIRGVASDGVLRHLIEKGLVRIAGRSDGVGRPLLYGTARDFLKFFGLKTLADLPRIREIEDLLKDEGDEAEGSVPVDSIEGGEGDTRGEAPGVDVSAGEDSEAEQETQEVGGDTVAVSKADAEEDDPDDEVDGGPEGEADAGTSEQISGESGSRIQESV